jgi:hypothetical protein
MRVGEGIFIINKGEIMLHQSKLTGFFRVALIVIFSGVMILGTGNSNSAQAGELDNVLDGLAKGKGLCDGETKKSKFKRGIWVQIVGDAPNLAALVTIDGLMTFELSGTSSIQTTKKGKKKPKGVFLLSGNDDMTSELTLNGKFNLNKEGTIFKVGGKFELLNTDGNCLVRGKFKAMDKV